METVQAAPVILEVPRAVKVKAKARRPKVKPKAKRGTKKKPSSIVRSERLDMRLSKANKARIVAKAKRLRRTVTSLVIEAIEKIR